MIDLVLAALWLALGLILTARLPYKYRCFTDLLTTDEED